MIIKYPDIKLRLFFTILLSNPFIVIASDVHVSSIVALQSAINKAAAGDVLILDNGIYINNTLNIVTNNITIKAFTPGGAILNGTNAISISGNDITFIGFQFISGSINGIVIDVSGSHNILTQLNFIGYSAQKYINLQGQYNEVSFCNFENKPTTAPIGNLIHIAPDPVLPGYNRIRNCSFKNIPGNGGDNGNECIRISNGATSTYVSRTVVEYCYFENTGRGDSESISVKCRENILRYNTSINNQEAMFVFRNGDNNVAYGNFFINAGGIRVKEANNIYCYNNYFENSGVGGDMNAVTYVYYTTNTVNVLKNINFIHNTFVECGDIDFDKGATTNTWANNIFQKSSGKIFSGSVSGITFSGNIYNGNLGVYISSGMTYLDPKLEINSDSYYSLSSTSPAIDASSSNYPSIMDIVNVDDDPNLILDISGQPRPAALTLKDVGCDEFTNGKITNRPLKLSDVGPTYLQISSGEKEIIIPSSFQLFQNYPNPFNPETRINYSLERSGFVSIKIYDLLGKEVAKLLNEYKSEGYHSVILNAGKYSLSSGVYFYIMKTDNMIQTKKMMLLK